MNQRYSFFALFLLFFSLTVALQAQTIWDGPTVVFEKDDGADWTQAASQDRLTDNVWLTRANIKGLFNIAKESDYTDFVSPEDTEWAYGTMADLATLDFDTWENTNGSVPPSMVGEDMVLHLITDDIYIDIKFTYWASGMQGGQGGFAYERSSNPVVSTDDLTTISGEIRLFPNPATDHIQLLDLQAPATYRIFDLLGNLQVQGVCAPNQSIDVQGLGQGIYLLRLDNGLTKKFVRK